MSVTRAIYVPGDRVSLATLEREDVPTLHRWLNDPRVLPTLIQLRPYDLVAEYQWFDGLDRKPVPSQVHFAIVAGPEQRLVGTTGLLDIHWPFRFAQTATLIGDPTDWGHGYASAAKALLCRYAFDTLGLHRLESHTLAGNLASQRHLLKNGFQREGVFRSRVFRAGAWQDTVHFGLLSADWRRQTEPAPPQGG